MYWEGDHGKGMYKLSTPGGRDGLYLLEWETDVDSNGIHYVGDTWVSDFDIVLNARPGREHEYIVRLIDKALVELLLRPATWKEPE